MDLDHSFDLKGFQFAVKLFLALTTVGLAGHFGLAYATAPYETRTTEPMLVVVNDAPREKPSIAIEDTPSQSWIAQRTAPPPIQTDPSPTVPAPVSQPRPLSEARVVPTPLAPLRAASFSTTTSQRVISALTITDVVPPTGKFLAADLVNMKLMLYRDGNIVTEYPILNKGEPGTPNETPAGIYKVLTKERDHFNGGQKVHLPWAMQFYANYFIHGWPYFVDGRAVNPDYSGGCIRLSTSDAEKVFAFSDINTKLFVYDTKKTKQLPSLALDSTQTPRVSAAAYLVADIDTGDVYLEQHAGDPRPIASITKLMTALVANETIMFYKNVAVERSELSHAQDAADSAKELFLTGDLLYPLLMESNNAVADRLARYYGAASFVGWMNATAKSLDMSSTRFVDASGVSSGDVSTPDDLYRLATYLVNKKSFIFDITRTPAKRLVASSGNVYDIRNLNIFSGDQRFIGGKVGRTDAAGNTMISLFSVPVGGELRRIAVVVLKSDDYRIDTTKLSEWFTRSAERGLALSGAACVTCAAAPQYRKIQ